MSDKRSDRRKARFAEAYREMSSIPGFWPEMSSDDLAGEIDHCATKLQEQDDRNKFILRGCLNYPYNKLFTYLHNASESCFGSSDDLPLIKRLVQMAAEEIARIEKQNSTR